MQKIIDWDPDKSKWLCDTRGVSFEMVKLILNGEVPGLLEVREHHNQSKYPNQRLFVVEIDDYVYIVPFVEDSDKIFLKTIIPSRKLNKYFKIHGKSN